MRPGVPIAIRSDINVRFPRTRRGGLGRFHGRRHGRRALQHDRGWLEEEAWPIGVGGRPLSSIHFAWVVTGRARLRHHPAAPGLRVRRFSICDEPETAPGDWSTLVRSPSNKGLTSQPTGTAAKSANWQIDCLRKNNPPSASLNQSRSSCCPAPTFRAPFLAASAATAHPS
jgi:hypothetical protein